MPLSFSGKKAAKVIAVPFISCHLQLVFKPSDIFSDSPTLLLFKAHKRLPDNETGSARPLLVGSRASQATQGRWANNALPL